MGRGRGECFQDARKCKFTLKCLSDAERRTSRLKNLLFSLILLKLFISKIEFFPLNRNLSDNNYYKSKYKDLKASLRTKTEDLQAKKEK